MKLDDSILRNFIDKLPFHIFWFDKNLKFSGANEIHNQSFGVNSSALIGRDMYDCGKTAKIDDENINLISKTMEQTHNSSAPNCLVFSDSAVNSNAVFCTWYLPLTADNPYDPSVLGISINLSSVLESARKSQEALHDNKNLENTLNILSDLTKRTASIEKYLNKTQLKLSNQEKNCIILLAKGMTANEIGKMLNLSNRTVQHYIENAKNKFSCKNNAELIYQCANRGII